ncbi:MAG: biosynthetic peptidoglycan transglycosylase [Pseudomonadota bacterium]
MAEGADRVTGKPATRSRVRRRAPASSKKSAKGSAKPSAKGVAKAAPRRSVIGWALRWTFRYLLRAAAVFVVLLLLWVGLLRFVDPPFGGPYMIGEFGRLGTLSYEPLPLGRFGLRAGQAAVAAEDARFCEHKGLDWAAIELALDEYVTSGRLRGGSTITQQTAKNVFLWHGRTMVRKALEVPMAGLIELVWGKERILEMYLNIAEFDEGVFGLEAGAKHYYGVPAAALTDLQMARMMTLLPAPKSRNPKALSATLERRARRIAAGVGTIEAQGLDLCFR